MANVLQYGKRGGYLPRAMNGYISQSETYAERTPTEKFTGCMPAMMQTLDIMVGAHPDLICYQVQVTEDEAIRIAGKWLSDIATRRTRDKVKSEQAARNARGQ